MPRLTVELNARQDPLLNRSKTKVPSHRSNLPLSRQICFDPGVLEYRDGGMSQDYLVRTVIRKALNYLKPGGSLPQLLRIGKFLTLGHPGRLGKCFYIRSKTFLLPGLCSATGLIPLTMLKCGFVTPVSNCTSDHERERPVA